MKPGHITGSDLSIPQNIPGKIVMCIYAVTVMFMLANIFIATLNDFFAAAHERINIELSEAEAQDPIDFVLMNTKGTVWKLFGILFNFATRKRRKEGNKMGAGQRGQEEYFTGQV